MLNPMKRNRVAWASWACLFAGATLWQGCAGSDAASGARGGVSNNGFVSGTGGASASGDAFGGTMGGPTVAPKEMEDTSTLQLAAPQAGDHYVYALDPDNHSVVLIDAVRQAVKSISTGRLPAVVRTLKGSDDAIVLNAGTDDASIIRPAADGSDVEVQSVPVVQGANEVAVAPDGRRAVAYYSIALAQGSSGELGELQGVSVLFLDESPARSVSVSVGFRPRSVTFSKDGSRGYVITQEGISVLDFAKIKKGEVGIATEVSFGKDAQTPDDVSVTSDGRFALGHDANALVIRLVDLESGDTQALDIATLLPNPDANLVDADAGVDDAGVLWPRVISDLDLAADGSFALIVLREDHFVLRVDLPTGFADPNSIRTWSIPDAFVGQSTLLPAGDIALLYSTAVAEEQIVILPLEGDDEPKYVDVRKTVRAIGVSDDGQTAVILHGRTELSPTEPGISDDERLDRESAYTLLRPQTGYALIRTTPVDPGAFVIVPDGSYLMLTLRDDSQVIREVHRIDLFSFQNMPVIPLRHPPLSIGVVAKIERAFVHQEYTGGSMTFIAWKTGELHTFSGYELNNDIRN